MFQAGVSWLFQRIVYAAEESLMLPKSIIFIGHYEHASSTQVFKLPCLFCAKCIFVFWKCWSMRCFKEFWCSRKIGVNYYIYRLSQRIIRAAVAFPSEDQHDFHHWVFVGRTGLKSIYQSSRLYWHPLFPRTKFVSQVIQKNFFFLEKRIEN